MTTHPPGGPTGPTGPGRLSYADLEAHHSGIGEPHTYSLPPLPRYGQKVRDVERLLRQVLDAIERPCAPESEPTVLAEPVVSDELLVHDVLFADAARAVKVALRKIAVAADLPSPPVGSAIRLPAAAGKETPGPSLDGAPPVAPGRGAGPGVIGPSAMDPTAFAHSVSAALARQLAARWSR